MAIKISSALPTAGVNLTDDPVVLPTDTAQMTKNVWPTRPGTVSARPSTELLAYGEQGGADLRNTIALAILSSSINNADYLMVNDDGGISGDEYRYSISPFSKSNSDWLQTGDVYSLSKGVYGRGCLVKFNDLIFFFDGWSPGVVWSAGFDSGSWTRSGEVAPREFLVGFSSAEPSASKETVFAASTQNRLIPNWRPRVAVMCKERLVIFNVADSHQNAMYWSDKNYPFNFDVSYWFTPAYLDLDALGLLDIDGPYVRLGGQNEAVTAALVISTSNEQSLATEAILVFQRTHVFFVTGEPGQTLDLEDPDGTLDVKELSVRAGCVAVNACCTTPYGAFWVGPDEVWFMPSGNLPIRVGTKISAKLREVGENEAWKVQCVYAAGKLVVTLPINGGATAAEGEEWWLDLRRGPPSTWLEATWFGPQVFTLTEVLEGITVVAHDQSNDSIVGVAVDSIYYYARLLSFDGLTGEDLMHRTATPRPWPGPGVEVFENDIITVPVASTLQQLYPNTSPSCADHLVEWRCEVSGVTGVTRPTGFGTCSPFTDGTVGWSLNVWPSSGARGGSQVLVDILSREESLGDLATQKTFDGVELSHSLNAPLAIELTSLGSTRHQALDRPTDGSAAQKQLVVGEGPGVGLQLAARALGTRFLPAGPSDVRHVGVSHSFRFKTLSKFVFNRDRYFLFSLSPQIQLGSDGYAKQYITAVAAGIYDTLEDVVTQLNSGIAATARVNTPELDEASGFKFGFSLRDGTYTEFRTGKLLSFATMFLTWPLGLNPDGLEWQYCAAVPVVGAEPTADFVLGQWGLGGTWPVTPPEFFDPGSGETVNLYHDTHYLMQLLGFDPSYQNFGPGITLYTGSFDDVSDPSLINAEMPYNYYKLHPRFDIMALNFRLRTFAKRPT